MTASIMGLPKQLNSRFLDYVDRFTIRFARTDKSIWSQGAHNREGHEFHSCRTGLKKICGFQPLGFALVLHLEMQSRPQRLKPTS